MQRLTGQAARALHALTQFAVALVLTAALGLTALSWRLSRGPLELPWLAQRVAAAVDAETPGHLALASAALAWQGFRSGFDQPLAIRLTGLSVADDAGRRLASVPRAQVALSMGWLLLGRFVPRSIELDGARLRVTRAGDGGITLDLGGLTDSVEHGGAPIDTASLLRELARPAAADRARASRWSQLEHVRISGAAVTVEDRQLAMTWTVPALAIDLRRRPQGGVFGQAEAKLALGGQTADLTASAELRGDHTTHVAARLSTLVPASLASLTPAASALAAVDAPVGVSATADLDAELRPTHLAGFLDAGAGTLHAGTGTMPLREAHVEAAGTLAAMHVALTRLVTAPRPDGPRTTIQAQADITRADDGAMQVKGALDLDQVAFADLAAVWPEGTGGGARLWVTRNLTEGSARNGHAEAALDVPADFSAVSLSRIDGRVEGHDVTVHWLPPVPPIEHAEARLTIRSPEALVIDLTAGRQAGGGQGGLVLQAGRATVTGLDAKDQFADISAELTGPVPDLLVLLRHPRLKLLERSPLPVHDAAGQLAGNVTVTRLPLRDDVSVDAVHIRADARVTGLRLPGIAAGRDLDRGALDVQASPDGLHAAGTAELAGIASQLKLDMDFRTGPPSQVTQKATVSGTVTPEQLAGLGLPVGDRLTGTLDLSAELQTRRDRQGSVEVRADLARATILADPLGYVKPAGQDARLSARLVLAGERIASIEDIKAQGDGLSIDAAAQMAGGAPSLLRVQRVVLGRGTDLHGTVRLPVGGGAYAITLAGATLDASALLRRTDHDAAPAAAGAPWSMDATLDRLIVGPGRIARAVTLHAENDGTVLRRAALAGRTADGTPFQLAVEPQAGGRRLTASTQDAGGLLRLFNVLDSMQGGHLTVTGSYDDTQVDHPLSGTATIETFRIRNAPALARLLQAMTLYGVLELAQGPGLGFSRLEAPFRYAGDTLSLADARAYSASLGMTAKGSVQLGRRQVDLTGTIVPAYFFNTLLGRIPLVGRLFSPERGGGVFSATYAVRGRLDSPDVSINPLAALTPGALRGLFNLF